MPQPKRARLPGPVDAVETLASEYPPLSAVGTAGPRLVAEDVDPSVPIGVALASTRRRREQRRRTVGRASNVDKDRRDLGGEVLRCLSDLTSTVRGDTSLPSRFAISYADRLEHNGTETALQYLKSESSACRQTWVLKNGGDIHAQCSFVGRALPVGSAEAMTKAVSQHYSDMTSAWSTGDELLARARSFARSWGQRYLGRPSQMASPGVPTLSACSERTVRQGGLRGFVAELGTHPDASALADELSRTLPYQDVQTVVNDLSYLCHGRDLSAGVLPASSVVCLAERGLKTRVITKSPAALHLLGHVVRKRLLSGLRRDPSSASTLQGVTDEGIIGFYEGASDEVCVSTDLTRASDLLPHDLMSALIDGLEGSGRLPQMEADVLRLLCGPQLITYPSLAGQPTITSTRGILMGLPTTWAMLSLAHMFWWDCSIRDAAWISRLPLKDAFSLNRFQVCGDDALFLGWDLTQERYLDIMAACGGVPSAGKHFVCRSPAKRGVFLERLYEFRSVQGRVYAGSRNGAVAIRGLVRPDIPESLRGHGSSFAMAPMVKMLYAVDNLWTTHPGGLPKILSFLERRPEVRAFARGLGLMDGLHLSDGGTGLPLRSIGPDAVKLRWRVLKAKCEGSTIPSLLRGVIDPAWQLASEISRADLAQFFQDGTFIEQLAGDPQPPPRDGAEFVSVGSKEKLVDDACESMYSDIVLSLGLPTKTPRLSEKRLRDSVKGWVRGLPPIPPGTDVTVDPSSDEKVVWVCRTRAPDGSLLFPRWTGEDRASEGTRRATFARLLWESRKGIG